MKNIYYLFMLLAASINAQVGIGTANPNSTLTVNGSFGANYKEITANTYTLAATDHYITYNGSSNATFTLPSIGAGITSYTGRIYKIKNLSTFSITLQASNGNTLRIDNNPVSTFIIPPSIYAEIVNNNNTSGGTWDLSFSVPAKPNNVEIYGTQVQIPPHANAIGGAVADWTNHSNTSYDSGSGTDTWWIISKTSFANSHTSANYHNTSRMTLVYEYQGTPFNITSMYPLLTAGNSSGFPDVFNASFINLQNNGTSGKTRLTVSAARIDFVGINGTNSSDWSGTFLINVLLARKLN